MHKSLSKESLFQLRKVTKRQLIGNGRKLNSAGKPVATLVPNEPNTVNPCRRKVKFF